VPELPPVEVLVQIGYAAAAAAAVLLVTWPWRERGWPVPVALGAGALTCHVASVGFPAPWPAARADRLFHLAALGVALGAVEARVRVPAVVRWLARAAACAGCAWALLLPADPPLRVALVAGAGFVAWSAFEWRAARVEGYGGPAALVVVAAAGAQALAFANSGRLGQQAGALAAAAAALLLYALLLRPRLTLARGGVTAFMLVALPLWICGWRLARLPVESAALLTAAPIAAQPRGWLGAIAALVPAALAAYLSWRANATGFDPTLGY
jgi:hypothetical protein